MGYSGGNTSCVMSRETGNQKGEWRVEKRSTLRGVAIEGLLCRGSSRRHRDSPPGPRGSSACRLRTKFAEGLGAFVGSFRRPSSLLGARFQINSPFQNVLGKWHSVDVRWGVL
jgi:hypothetical protein